MKLTRSIRWRLVASYVFLTLLTVFLVGILALSLVKRYTEKQETDFLVANAEAVAHRAEPLMWMGPPGSPALAELARTAAFLGNVRVRILDNADQVIADSGGQNVANNFIWIQPAFGLRLQIEQQPPLFLRAVQGAEGNIPYSSLMILPPSGRLPSEEALEQLPPGATYFIGRRSGDAWGHRFVFDEIKRGGRPGEPLSSYSIEPQGQAGLPDHDLAGRELIEVLIEGLGRSPDTGNDLGNDLLPETSTNPSATRSGRVITVPIGEPGNPMGYVEFSDGPNFAAESIATTRQALILAALGAMALAVVVGLFVSRGLTAPLRSLTAATDAMSAGDLGIRAPVQSQDEIGRLADQFNQMAGRLEASFAELAAERDALRRFIADASHEFRTPITALKNFNELLQGAAADDPAARREFLTESEKQLQRLDWITQNLLNLSRFDAGLVELNLSQCDVGALLAAAGSAFKAAAQEKEIELTITSPPSLIMLQCDRLRLESALFNLLDNAIRFTPPGGQIELGGSLIRERDEDAPGEPEAIEGDRPDDQATETSLVRLWVKDTGPGVYPDDLPYLFKRFYRGRYSGSESNKAEGSGLGLAIVDSIAQLHQGRVYVSNNTGPGSCFVIELPHFR
jgi:signal transduction histidine kinase